MANLKFNLEQCFDMMAQPYKLNQLNRFSTEYHLHEETVAAHSFYVNLFVMYLSNYYTFDLDKALKLALVHDLPESIISDFPFHIKEAWPSLKNEFDKLDSEYSKTFNNYLLPNASILMDEFNKCETKEAVIANFADMLSSCLFCYTELKLGNLFFKPKYESKYAHCLEYFEKLDELRLFELMEE